VGRGIRGAALCCAVTALAATGCGSSSKKDTNTTSSAGGVVQQPKPTQPISAVVPLLNKAIKDQSCAEFAAIDFSLGRQTLTPGAAPVGTECKFFKRALKTSKSLRYTHGQEYGTGAILEGPAPAKAPTNIPGKPVSLALFLLDRDGHYRFLIDHVDVKQIGTKPSAAANDGGKNAQAVVDAVRAGDCKKGATVIHPGGTLAHSYHGNTTQACKALAGGKIFAPSLKETAHPKAVLLGATRDYQFYGVATKKTYFTLLMATPPGTSDKPPLLFETVANTDNPAIPKTQPAG
jgi:hypothetical protein